MSKKQKALVSIINISTCNITMPGAAEANISIVGLGTDGRTYAWSHQLGVWLPNWASGVASFIEAQKKLEEARSAKASGLPSAEKRAKLRKKRA